MFPAILLLILGLWSAAATINAFRPFRQTLLLFPSMLWSWLVIGLPVQHVVIQVVIAGLLVWWGALDELAGWIGLLLLVISWIGSLMLLLKTRRSGAVVETALAAHGIRPSGRSVPTWRIVLAAPFKGRNVQKISNVPFRKVAGRVLKLDVYRSPGEATGRPALLYIHGGGWTVGDKREQGLPLLHHLARNGWVCFSANYRLSPGGTFPDHLVDVKRAIAWIRDHADDLGVDDPVAGEVGEYVAFARRERGGPDWYLGAVTDEDARTVQVPLDFLEPGRPYTAQIYRDGEGADWKTNPYAITVEERAVGHDEVLSLWLAPGGGAAGSS